MFVQDGQRSLGLVDCDEFLCSLYDDQYYRLEKVSCPREPTLSTFSGLICGGGGMLGSCRRRRA
jgi:hypothetical protein